MVKERVWFVAVFPPERSRECDIFSAFIVIPHVEGLTATAHDVLQFAMPKIDEALGSDQPTDNCVAAIVPFSREDTVRDCCLRVLEILSKFNLRGDDLFAATFQFLHLMDERTRDFNIQFERAMILAQSSGGPLV